MAILAVLDSSMNRCSDSILIGATCEVETTNIPEFVFCTTRLRLRDFRFYKLNNWTKLIPTDYEKTGEQTEYKKGLQHEYFQI